MERSLCWSNYCKVLFCVEIYDCAGWVFFRCVGDGVGRDICDEVDSGVGEGVEL